MSSANVKNRNALFAAFVIVKVKNNNNKRRSNFQLCTFTENVRDNECKIQMCQSQMLLANDKLF